MQKFYYIQTYGCQMNVHESEKLAGMLEELGYKSTERDNADIIVFNTCCIRDNAEKKIEGNIGELKQIKKRKPDLVVAVVGCMSQQEGIGGELKKKFPYIDIILGTSNINELPSALRALEKKRFFLNISDEERPEINEGMPVFRTSGTNAWVNIMYGCNNFCTYCIVPHVRGRERSRKKDVIIDEIKQLLDLGYKEITLLGQNVDSYGSDLFGKPAFDELLYDISKIEGKFRLRFMTSHPKDFNKGIVDIIRGCDNICNNVHLPVQSGSNRILQKMNRKYTREHYIELVNEILTLPNVGITTDIMVGFPGETDEDFSDTLSLVKDLRFSNAFMFVFSPRRGTPAAAMEQISAAVKKERIQELVALQNSISREISKEYFGKTYEVLIEDINPKHIATVCGRTESGRLVNFPGEASLIGTFADIKIKKANSATLWGTIDEQ